MIAAPDSRMDLHSRLRFYAEAGVDAAVADEPLNRFQDTAPPARVPRPSSAHDIPRPAGASGSAAPVHRPPAPAVRPASVPDDTQAALARELLQVAEAHEEWIRQYLHTQSSAQGSP